jgi:hypothetical protein
VGSAPTSPMSYSAEANKEYLNERYERQRQTFFTWLGGAYCVRCGSTENLQIDHIDYRKKKMDVGRLWPLSELGKVFVELQKCQVLCDPCHRKKTAAENVDRERDPYKHGTWYAYQKIGCRCEQCLEIRILRNGERRKGGAYKVLYVPNRCSCGAAIRRTSTQCYDCDRRNRVTKIDWPPPDEVRKMVDKTSYLATGRQLGVSDNAVRKYLKRNGS